MLLLEFPETINHEPFDVRYKDSTEQIWKIIKMDLVTLNLLLNNLGFSSTKSHTLFQKPFSIDNYSTGPKLTLRYYGAEVIILCNNRSKEHFKYGDDLRILES